MMRKTWPSTTLSICALGSLVPLNRQCRRSSSHTAQFSPSYNIEQHDCWCWHSERAQNSYQHRSWAWSWSRKNLWCEKNHNHEHRLQQCWAADISLDCTIINFILLHLLFFSTWYNFHTHSKSISSEKICKISALLCVCYCMRDGEQWNLIGGKIWSCERASTLTNELAALACGGQNQRVNKLEKPRHGRENGEPS